MKTETHYSCDHCGYTSTDKAAVEACEAIPMAPAGVEIGDIVSTGGGGYGWWEGDESWFHRYSDEERKKMTERFGHHAGIGQPMFVVLDIVPYPELQRNGVVMHGEWAHKMVPILYSPSHANRGGTRIAYGWTSGSYVKRGRVEPDELKRFQLATAKLGRPEYFSY